MSTAERLLDSLRDLLYVWTHRFTWRQSSRAGAARGARTRRIDVHALVERQETRRATTASSAGVPIRERVTMHDHAVSRIYDRNDRETWGEC